MIGPLSSSPIVRRYPGNPILSADDVPYESRLAYNPGVVKYQGRYVMVFRNDYGFSENEVKAPNFQLGLAYSDDGVHWQVQPKPILEPDDPEVLGNYDPRLTLLEGRVMITYAQYTRHGFRATIAATTDFERFEILDRSVPDNRDNVLFPEKVGGRYLRLERPFPF